MRRQQLMILSAFVGLSLASAPMSAQTAGGGMMGGMMGMRGMGGGRDSATMAQLAVIHDLLVNHERIKRVVTKLPDGVRTVTESDDPRVAQLIKDHVQTMGKRAATGDDPNLPMESPALRSIIRDYASVRRASEKTEQGIIVTETSSNPAVAAALQQHAEEISDLVRGGMAAMHAAMMRNRSGTPPAHTDHDGHAAGGSDTAFAALQRRGQQAMGVDQNTSIHHFDALPDGGRIELFRTVDDPVGVEQIRTHLKEIAKAFKSGDFSTPAFVHMQEVPGVKVMAAKRAVITYTYRDAPWGGELQMITQDGEARAAIHEFLSFQREDHRTERR